VKRRFAYQLQPDVLSFFGSLVKKLPDSVSVKGFCFASVLAVSQPFDFPVKSFGGAV
jgi:hypothetical protein